MQNFHRLHVQLRPLEATLHDGLKGDRKTCSVLTKWLLYTRVLNLRPEFELPTITHTFIVELIARFECTIQEKTEQQNKERMKIKEIVMLIHMESRCYSVIHCVDV